MSEPARQTRSRACRHRRRAHRHPHGGQQDGQRVRRVPVRRHHRRPRPQPRRRGVLQETNLGHRVAHGALVVGYMSAASTRILEDFARPMVSMGYDRIRFIKPVFFGDTLTITYEITGVVVEKERTIGAIEVTNQRGRPSPSPPTSCSSSTDARPRASQASRRRAPRGVLSIPLGPGGVSVPGRYGRRRGQGRTAGPAVPGSAAGPEPTPTSMASARSSCSPTATSAASRST